MKKIILSTDIGSDIDDALALLVMLNYPAINLKSICTVNGDVVSRSYIAKHMADLSGKEIAVACGKSDALGAMVKPYSFFENDLVDETFIDDKRMEDEGFSSALLYKKFTEVGVDENAVKHMAKLLAEEAYIIFSIGPLTNIACLLREHPEAAHNIERLYIMGSRLDRELEHNFRFDALAAKEVLASDIPITLVPGDVCNKYRMPTDLPGKLGETPTGAYVLRMLRAFLGAKFAHEYQVYQDVETSLHNELRDKAGLWASKPEDYLGDRINRFQYILANLDPETACLDPDDFWGGVNVILEELEKRKEYKLLTILKALIPDSVSVADVFVPYVFLHPEKTTSLKKNITCDFDGVTVGLSGERHEVISDVDMEHFASFLRENLR